MKCAEHVARAGDIINVYVVLVRKSEGKGSLGKPRRRWRMKCSCTLREQNMSWNGFNWTSDKFI
jgi:hypothetical protein